MQIYWLLVAFSGFLLSLIGHVDSTACNGTVPVEVQGPSTSLVSPGYPNNFTSGLTCLYNVTIPAGYILKLIFADFNLKEKVNERCDHFDYLMLKNTVSLQTPEQKLELCGQDIPTPVYSKSNWISLKFISRSSNQYRGFNITLEAIVENDVCPSNDVISSKSGNISSPYYPRFLPKDKTCNWMITAPKGKHIMLKMLDFSVLSCGYSCNCGYLQVAIGKSASHRRKQFCQRGLIGPQHDKAVDLRKPIYSLYNNIWMTFKTYDSSSNYPEGFLLSYEQIDYTPPVCPDGPFNLTNINGSLSSPNYPMKYPIDTQCSWLITVAPNSRIKLNFTELQMEGQIPGYDNCFDWVKVYDGPTSASGLLGETCDKNLPGPVVSSGNQMLIKFFSGSHGVEKGFHAEYITTKESPSPTVKPPTTRKSSTSTLFFSRLTTSVGVILVALVVYFM